MKYLIIGGAGFIGSNFSKLLIENGEEVIICDNLSRKGTTVNLSYFQENYKGRYQFIYLDIRNDYEKLISIVNNVDVVFHLAAQVAVTTSVYNPKEDFSINAFGTFNILEAIRLSNNKPLLIYASTNKVYGEMENIGVVEKDSRYHYTDLEKGISEKQNLDFHSPYGCSKGTGDQYVIDYSRIYGLKTVVFRQSCIYGPMQFGIEDQGWVAWFAIASILNKSIKIYGDGKQVRDVLSVFDLFELWYLASKNIDKINGQAFNIGGGHENVISLLELIEILKEKLNKKIEYQFDEWRPGDQKIYISDITKIRNLTGWKPKITIYEGLDLLLMWVKSNEKVLKSILG